MLQGTFETLALPEVLGLLASARKTGALRLEAGPVSGVVHLEDGHCRAVETPEAHAAVADTTELLARLVDVCFAVTRQESGAFRFVEEPAPWLAEPVELSDALVEVDRLLKQWREILRVIPSLECRPRLLEALDVDEIVLDRERWALVVGIDGRRTVRELVQRAARPVIDVCHTLLELVEAGAIGVIDPAAAVPTAPTEAAPAPAATRPAEPNPAEPKPVDVKPEPAPVAAKIPEPKAPETKPAFVADGSAANGAAAAPAAATLVAEKPERETANGEIAPGETSGDEGGDGPDKGAFLRLFSGLRDS